MTLSQKILSKIFYFLFLNFVYNFFVFFSIAVQTFKLLEKYRPESELAKKQRLKKEAEAKAKGTEKAPTKRPNTLKAGTNTVTKLIEQKKAQLVVIAHDVDPIEVNINFVFLSRFSDDVRISSPENINFDFKTRF